MYRRFLGLRVVFSSKSYPQVSVSFGSQKSFSEATVIVTKCMVFIMGLFSGWWLGEADGRIEGPFLPPEERDTYVPMRCLGKGSSEYSISSCI
ncbi:uncharacterized protein P174DRAFT_440847 [Aspergillus novofumigatus IBT 16806]|uniref:Uncharacterized protein n=1 Tax=Aspergillus novofumigatus (strain IBT 16806) TaxID=1392255 RepID=A0A2I1C7F5_ASPN1|nr:uncharacterized protein P174DRAFT_440847 [Aspergillus novofumigatus IBT 16806]PKX93570.1 hypothetical protein P174DRAFT_440847 [Aspergillus novofumigatus IBT 16806]